MVFLIFTDGSSHGNSGSSITMLVLRDPSKNDYMCSRLYLPKATHNEVEYIIVIKALINALHFYHAPIILHCDSQNFIL